MLIEWWKCIYTLHIFQRVSNEGLTSLLQLFWREESNSHNLNFIRDDPLLLQPVSVFTKYTLAATKLQSEISLLIIIVCACMCVCVCLHASVHTCMGGRRLEFTKLWLIHDACIIMIAVFSCGCCLHAALAFDHMMVLCVQTHTRCHSVTVKIWIVVNHIIDDATSNIGCEI